MSRRASSAPPRVPLTGTCSSDQRGIGFLRVGLDDPFGRVDPPCPLQDPVITPHFFNCISTYERVYLERTQEYYYYSRTQPNRNWFLFRTLTPNEGYSWTFAPLDGSAGCPATTPANFDDETQIECLLEEAGNNCVGPIPRCWTGPISPFEAFCPGDTYPYLTKFTTNRSLPSVDDITTFLIDAASGGSASGTCNRYFEPANYGTDYLQGSAPAPEGGPDTLRVATAERCCEICTPIADCAGFVALYHPDTSDFECFFKGASADQTLSPAVSSNFITFQKRFEGGQEL